MGKQTSIGWTDSTHNFWTGCHKVSVGCKFCYAERIIQQFGISKFKDVKKSKLFTAPLKWTEPRLIFTCSMSDFFIEEADKWREEAWEVIRKTPRHIYQILTKRPERIERCLPKDWRTSGYPNVWLGVSVESQNNMKRLPMLEKIPCAFKFVSFEPLLEKLQYHSYENWLDWVIVGGESGTNGNYRPCELEWIELIVNDCNVNGVPCFVKQLGTHLAKSLRLRDWKGADVKEFPEQLRVQEFPKLIPAQTLL